MIYLDTSVVLAQLLAADRRPAPALWKDVLVSSRLLEYELWTALHRQGLATSHGEAARAILARLAYVELGPEALARALEPFPKPVRSLDALHLASADFLRARGQKVAIASYDERFLTAARALKLEIAKV